MLASKIKAKSLLGITLAACATAIAFQPPTQAEIGNMSEILVQTADMMNQQLPMMVDADTRWDSSSAGPGKVLSYKYTLVNHSANHLDGTQFAKNIHPTLTDLICNNPATQIFPDNGVLLNFNYYDKSSNLIARVKVTPNDCR
ncbi:MAG: hypothetical protein AAFQ14_19035 [Cyanobacteria bacterium J06621_12]